MPTPLEMRAARLAGGFKLREIAAAAKLEPSTVWSLEAGRFAASDGAASRWCEALIRLLADRNAAIDTALSTLAH